MFCILFVQFCELCAKSGKSDFMSSASYILILIYSYYMLLSM